MNWFQTTRENIGFCRRRLLGALAVGMVMLGASAFGQSMRFRPIRSAPLGSPVGTIGEPVTSQFNDELGCWEVFVPAGTEVDLAIEATDWELAPGAPFLYAILATVESNGYSNGIGGDLNPKGWPDSPTDGAYLPFSTCQLGGDGRPCNSGPFGPCAAGFCVSNPNFIIPCAGAQPILSIGNLNYVWGATGGVCNVISGGLYADFAVLILEVPNNAAGTYVIALNPHPDDSSMFSQGIGESIPVDTFTPACITITNPILEPPIRAPAPHHILKNRYISIDPRGAMGINPASHHIRVRIDSTEAVGASGTGGTWWATDPVPGNQVNSDAVCLSVVVKTKPAMEPDWTGCPAVHLTGCPIVPTTTYSIVVEAAGIESPPGLFDTAKKPGIKWFGDVVGNFTGPNGNPPNVWSPPNLNVNADDMLATLRTFQDAVASSATHVSRTDVHPLRNGEQINLLVNIDDVLVVVHGFQGEIYNFGEGGPDLAECP